MITLVWLSPFSLSLKLNDSPFFVSTDGPLPPRALRLSIDRFNRVTLTWNEPEEVIDEYRINYGIKGTPGKQVTVQRDKKSYIISDFEEEKIYKISLWSVKEGKLSLPLSDEVLTAKKPGKNFFFHFAVVSISNICTVYINLSKN